MFKHFQQDPGNSEDESGSDDDDKASYLLVLHSIAYPLIGHFRHILIMRVSQIWIESWPGFVSSWRRSGEMSMIIYLS